MLVSFILNIPPFVPSWFFFCWHKYPEFRFSFKSSNKALSLISKANVICGLYFRPLGDLNSLGVQIFPSPSINPAR